MLRDFSATLFKSSKFNRETPIHGAAEVIRWWESRRLFFNAVVGGTGVITCVLMVVCAFLAHSTVGEPIGMPDGPLLGVFGILFYAILANVFYAAGWIFELLLGAATTAKKSAAFGLKAFRAGVAFSIFVTLPPCPGWRLLSLLCMDRSTDPPASERGYPGTADRSSNFEK